MATLLVELRCPEGGLERFSIKVIKKYNVSPRIIMPKFRTRPKHELSGVIIGKKVERMEVKDYVVEYFKEAGLIDRILSIKLI